jgi:hypothetical protein
MTYFFHPIKKTLIEVDDTGPEPKIVELTPVGMMGTLSKAAPEGAEVGEAPRKYGKKVKGGGRT